jgi:AraC family ethanolamine operon transcriptional activator
VATLVRHVSHDVDDQAEALNGFRQHYEQIGCGRFEGAVWQVLMSKGELLRESTNRQLREVVTPPPNHVAIAMPLAVQQGSVFAGRPLTRESLMVLNDAEAYDIAPSGEMDLIGMCVHRDLLAAMAPAKVDWVWRAERKRNVALAPDSASAIRQMLLAVNQIAESGLQELSEPTNEMALLSSTLTQTVILAMTGEESADHIPRRVDTRIKVVRRAIEFMRERMHDDIGVPEICIAACASRRSLQYCFEELMHTTPQAYLRAMRLNEARRLLKCKQELPITAIASELGFSSASHFTAHYKLMFDELPSATLRGRMRVASVDG